MLVHVHSPRLAAVRYAHGSDRTVSITLKDNVGATTVLFTTTPRALVDDLTNALNEAGIMCDQPTHNDEPPTARCPNCVDGSLWPRDGICPVCKGTTAIPNPNHAP